MKNKCGVLAFLFLLGFAGNAGAQTVNQISREAVSSKDTIPLQVVDQAKYRVYYFLSFVKDTAFTEKKTEAQTILLIGSKYSAFLDYNTLRKDSLYNALSKSGMGAMEVIGQTLSVGRQIKFDPTVMKNYPEAGEYTFQQMITSRDNYRYTDKNVEIDWVLGDEKKTLRGYECQQATCTYRGRDYVAWYCPEIALNDGPYVFSGLPGLIFEIYDTHNHYRFTLNGLTEAKGYDPLYFMANNVVETTRDKVRKIVSNLRANPASLLQLMGGRAEISPEVQRKLQPKPYNPIELE